MPDGTTKTALFCPDCNEFKDAEIQKITMTETHDDPDDGKILVVEENARTVGRSSGEMYCPKCDTIREVEYWEIQTRSADESATRFFKCLTCGKQWREYD